MWTMYNLHRQLIDQLSYIQGQIIKVRNSDQITACNSLPEVRQWNNLLLLTRAVPWATKWLVKWFHYISHNPDNQHQYGLLFELKIRDCQETRENCFPLSSGQELSPFQSCSLSITNTYLQVTLMVYMDVYIIITLLHALMSEVGYI